jgi:hypothetical protein
MVIAARRRMRHLEQARVGCWVNARGCLAIRYSIVASHVQQRSSSSTHTYTIACISLSRAHLRLIRFNQTATINKFQVLKRSSVWSRFGQLPNLSQPLANHPNLSVPMSSATPLHLYTVPILSPHDTQHLTFYIPGILSLTLALIAHSTPTR